MADESEWEACGRGICAAEEGHEGTCAQASGWDDEDDEAPIAQKSGAAR